MIFMNFFGKRNTKRHLCRKSSIVLHLNMRLMPFDRANHFEDPIDDILHKHDVDEVVGGGTFLSNDGMPVSCDIDFCIKNDKIDSFISFLKNTRTIAKGSYIQYLDTKIDIGVLEGLELILDGTGLSKEVYEENDVNDVISELNVLLNEKGQYYSHYIGKKDTSLYFYGISFDEMKNIIAKYAETCPLCKNSIINKI